MSLNKPNYNMLGLDIHDKFDGIDAQLGDNNLLLSVNMSSIQTTYDTNGTLTQIKEFDLNNNLLIQTDISYSPNGKVDTIIETYNNKTYTTTLNYTNGILTSVSRAIN